MAQRKRSSRGRKLEPSVKKLFFSVPLAGVSYLDISECASIANRRFYRQGLNWMVAGMRLHTAATTTGVVNIFKVQDTWMASNAWHKGYAFWNRMNDQVLDNQPSIRPKFHDFKIHMDSEHVSTQFANNLIPYTEDSAGVQTQYVEGEWTRSLIEMPNTAADGSADPGTTTAYALKMHGDDSTSSKAFIQGYADSRSVPTEPDPETQADADIGWMNNLLDMGDVHDDIALNLQTIGEDLPYSQMEYPGGGGNAGRPSLHGIVNVSATTVGGTTSVEGGNFQCGLIKFVSLLVDTASPAPHTAYELELILVPGPSRGYLTQPMQEV